MPRPLWPAATILMGAEGRGFKAESAIWKCAPLKLDSPVAHNSFITVTYSVD